MTSFPFGLNTIEFEPFLPMDGARDDAGHVWWTEDADPYWRGRATTSKLNPDRLQAWAGFVLDAMFNQRVIEFVDPIYRIPAAYRATGVLPFGFDGTGSVADLADPTAPVVANLPVGLMLRRGDRVGFVSGTNKTCHLVLSDLEVESFTAQALPVIPPVLPNVFGIGDDVVLLDPVLRLTIEPNSWSAPRRARVDAVGTFTVLEAGIV